MGVCGVTSHLIASSCSVGDRLPCSGRTMMPLRLLPASLKSLVTVKISPTPGRKTRMSPTSSCTVVVLGCDL